jgi:hypothetical protein
MTNYNTKMEYNKKFHKIVLAPLVEPGPDLWGFLFVKSLKKKTKTKKYKRQVVFELQIQIHYSQVKC